jgi:hypothetical protein
MSFSLLDPPSAFVDLKVGRLVGPQSLCFHEIYCPNVFTIRQDGRSTTKKVILAKTRVNLMAMTGVVFGSEPSAGQADQPSD